MALLLALGLGACRAQPAETLAPDVGKRAVAERAAVSTAHPGATTAALEVLRDGGNAVDAAVAAAFAIGVAEPQMSGLGGGGGMLIWMADPGRTEYLDFYAAQRIGAVRGIDPRPMRTDLRRVAIPGEVAGLLLAHQRFGRLPRERILAPAIALAEEGVPVNQVLAAMIADDSARLSRDPDAAFVFLPDGRPLAAGETLRQPDLAATLRRVAAEGAAGFYRGPVASSLMREMNAGGHPATLADLDDYAPQWKRPLCTVYRGNLVLSAPPPQTGSRVLQMLELLEPHPLGSLPPPTRSARSWELMVSAMRVAMADGRFNDDPNWTRVPAAAIASPQYAAIRRELVGGGRASAEVSAGDPAALAEPAPEPGCARLDPYRDTDPILAASRAFPEPSSGPEGGETTHLSVVDGEGNAVALTQTNSSVFGSGARVAGFFLNDSGIDPTGRDVVDAPAMPARPWRTRPSTIAPTLVLRDGRVRMVVGAPGGGAIPTEILQTLVYVLDFGMDPMEALRMPRILPSPRHPEVQLENGFEAGVLAEVREMGYRPVAQRSGYARLYMIVRVGGRWIAVADPRHNGAAAGY